MTSNPIAGADHCLNCHLKVAGSFCTACGQKVHFHADPRLHDVFHDAFHEFLHIDGKIFNSLKALILKPGFLTREYFNGRRQRYVTPIRLYLTMSILYFVVAAAFSAGNDTLMDKETLTAINQKIDLGEATPKGKPKKSDDRLLTGDIEFFGKKYSSAGLKKYIRAVVNHPDEFKHFYASAYPKALFCLLPLFALLLQASFGFRERYPQYLYFALHFHAALFAIATLLLFVPSEFMILWLTLGAIYFVAATRKVWGGSKRATLMRGAFVATFYSMFFLLALGVAGLYAIFKVA